MMNLLIDYTAVERRFLSKRLHPAVEMEVLQTFLIIDSDSID